MAAVSSILMHYSVKLVFVTLYISLVSGQSVLPLKVTELCFVPSLQKKKKKCLYFRVAAQLWGGKKKVSHFFVLSQKSVVRSGTLHVSNIQKFCVIASVNSVLLIASLSGKPFSIPVP